MIMEKIKKEQLLAEIGAIQMKKGTFLEECRKAQCLIVKTLKETGPVRFVLSDFWKDKIAVDRGAFLLTAFDDEGGTPVEFFEGGVGFFGWIVEASVLTSDAEDIVKLKVVDTRDGNEHVIELDDVEMYEDSVLDFIVRCAK